MKRIIMYFVFLLSLVSQGQDNTKDISVLMDMITKYEKSGDFQSKEYSTLINNLAGLYLDQNNYSKAEPLYLQSIAIDKKILGENHPDYSTSLNNLALLYVEKGEYQKAEPLYLQSLAIDKKILGENHPDYITSLNNLALLYVEKGEYQKAEPLYLQSLTIRKNVLGESHPDYSTSLNNLALLYVEKGENQKAEPLYLQSIAIDKKILGENHPDYATSLNNLALLYVEKGEYQKAEPLYLQSLAIRKNVLGENHQDYATSLNNLAMLYDRQGYFQKAESLYIQTIAIDKKVLGENHPDYAKSLNNLALLYVEKGDYQKAEPLYLQSIEIYKKVKGENHSDCATSLYNLASLYFEKGEYKKAEPLYLQSLTIRKNILGEYHPDYATSLNSLALFYKEQGDYQKAESLYIQTIAIDKKILGENHPDFTVSLNNLASLYFQKGDYQKAEPLYLQSLQIIKKVIGENHPQYASSLNNLALLYKRQGDYQKAKTLYLQSLQIIKKVLGENHPNYALLLNNLAFIYESQVDFKKAEALYLESLAINKMILGENHPHYAISIENLASFYQSIKPANKEKAAQYIQESFQFFQNNLKLASAYKTEKELSFFRIKNFNVRFASLSFLYHNTSQYNNINIGCFENELLVKNLSLRNQKQITNNIKKSLDKGLQNKYEQFILNKKQLTNLNELPKDKRPSNYEQINSETETLEKDLVRQSSSFADSKNALSINWKQVQVKLKTNELAIDLIAFNYYNKKWTDSIVYSAFVVGRDYKVPKFITLFEQKQLEILLAGNDDTKHRNKIDKQYTDKAVSDIFLKPLEKELEGINTIYLSPSGLGYQIDFAALPINNKQTLGEKYKLHIFSSPAEFIDYKVATLDKKSNIELLLYGGIDYDNSQGKSNISLNNNLISLDEELNNLAKRSGLEKLPGTLTEVEIITESAKSSGFSCKVIKESEATEESVKALDGRTTPYVLHLATHGFFFPDPIQEIPKENSSLESKSKIYKASDDPMMRSGLLLAGAKNYWGKVNQNNTIEDGILTASEISNLDLSSCQLAVLSACETGLGEIKGSEGVFGLQRAFKMAGVKNIIMSLWKVPDTQTAELFDIFYSECFAGKSIHEAFQSAQSQMKAKYSPYYWAGFVLLE